MKECVGSGVEKQVNPEASLPTELPHPVLKTVLLSTYLRVPCAAGHVKNLYFVILGRQYHLTIPINLFHVLHKANISAFFRHCVKHGMELFSIVFLSHQVNN